MGDRTCKAHAGKLQSRIDGPESVKQARWLLSTEMPVSRSWQLVTPIDLYLTDAILALAATGDVISNAKISAIRAKLSDT